jgi:hypothetical protein
VEPAPRFLRRLHSSWEAPIHVRACPLGCRRLPALQTSGCRCCLRWLCTCTQELVRSVVVPLGDAGRSVLSTDRGQHPLQRSVPRAPLQRSRGAARPCSPAPAFAAGGSPAVSAVSGRASPLLSFRSLRAGLHRPVHNGGRPRRRCGSARDGRRASRTPRRTPDRSLRRPRSPRGGRRGQARSA